MIKDQTKPTVQERGERLPQAADTRGEERLVLRNVRWETYEHLLADHEDRSAPRFAFDQGTLEIMSPLPEHEEAAGVLESLVGTLAAEWDLDFRSLGSTTFQRREQERGFEPDACFYIQNASQVQGKTRIELSVDPPPDVVIEIDITHSSLDKLPIFAAFGVPEVWRYRAERFSIYVLGDGVYQEAEQSPALPGLTAAIAEQFVRDAKTLRRREWDKRVREWARGQRGL